MFPNAQRLNRGNYVMSQLVHACKANDVTDLIIIHEHRGEPSEWLYNKELYPSMDKCSFEGNRLIFSVHCYF